MVGSSRVKVGIVGFLLLSGLLLFLLWRDHPLRSPSPSSSTQGPNAKTTATVEGSKNEVAGHPSQSNSMEPLITPEANVGQLVIHAFDSRQQPLVGAKVIVLYASPPVAKVEARSTGIAGGLQGPGKEVRYSGITDKAGKTLVRIDYSQVPQLTKQCLSVTLSAEGYASGEWFIPLPKPGFVEHVELALEEAKLIQGRLHGVSDADIESVFVLIQSCNDSPTSLPSWFDFAEIARDGTFKSKKWAPKEPLKMKVWDSNSRYVPVEVTIPTQQRVVEVALWPAVKSESEQHFSEGSLTIRVRASESLDGGVFGVTLYFHGKKTVVGSRAGREKTMEFRIKDEGTYTIVARGHSSSRISAGYAEIVSYLMVSPNQELDVVLSPASTAKVAIRTSPPIEENQPINVAAEVELIPGSFVRIAEETCYTDKSGKAEVLLAGLPNGRVRVTASAVASDAEYADASNELSMSSTAPASVELLLHKSKK